MPFDGLTIKAITTELQNDLVGGRIDKIYQPEKDELSLFIRQPGISNIKLLISANARWARMHISTSKSENPAKPSNFCMVLRKYLEGGKILKIEQIEFERIVHIHIESLDDFQEWKPKLLICEFMGKHSNIILVNPENNLIIDATKKYGSETSSYREVLPGQEYIIPPAQNKLDILSTSFENFTDYMWQQEDATLATAIFKVLTGISPFAGKQICNLVGLNPDMPVDECGEYEFITIFTYIKDLIEKIEKDGITGHIAYKKKIPIDYAPYPLGNMENVNSKSYETMNKTCDVFYKEKLSHIKLDSQKVNLSRNINVFLKKANKKQFHLESDQSKAVDNDNYRLLGEIITANAYKLKKGDSEVKLYNYYTDEDILITLDPRFTPIQNAQRYFKIYNKSRTALLHLKKLLRNNQQEIEYLESILVSVKEASNIAELEEIVDELEREGYIKSKKNTRRKSKPIKSMPREFLSSDGLTILVGRNNRQNDQLTLKEARKTDLWLHTKDIPGTHVIIKMPDNIKTISDLPNKTLEEAAGLAAYYSKAKDSEKVPVDYTFRLNVRKPKGAKPGMVIYDDFRTIMVNPQSEDISKLVETIDTSSED